ncbi:hypothetical protein EYF80_049642 [Liparis tanakae]|uniref:Uncharacterized protein n=1 Tax=Liparis tanakae TaxID=230148 RepID=A0A4Z2FHF3_9TELE|nr:hypothetical protein EYF80_049642 [Liparis tanakae]
MPRRLPPSSTLSVIFISWSILRPSPGLSESSCCPFTAVGSTTAGSGTAEGSGGVAASVIFSAAPVQ